MAASSQPALHITAGFLDQREEVMRRAAADLVWWGSRCCDQEAWETFYCTVTCTLCIYTLDALVQGSSHKSKELTDSCWFLPVTCSWKALHYNKPPHIQTSLNKQRVCSDWKRIFNERKNFYFHLSSYICAVCFGFPSFPTDTSLIRLWPLQTGV